MSVAAVCLYIYLFILIIYCKICTSSVDNIIFIMILTKAAEVKWQCANITRPILEWTKYARLVLHVTLYVQAFAGPLKK